MKLLGINSSVKQAEIVLKNEDIEDILILEEGKSHSEFLLVEIENLLNKNNLNLNDIEYLSINVGPGSFTGIRIGVSFVKAFILALNLKCVMVNNFELISHNVTDINPYFVVLSSNNEDFYYAYVENNNFKYGFSNLENFNNNINSKNLNVYCDENEKDNFINVKNIKNVVINKNSFLNVSESKALNNNFKEINEISPLYIKKSQAEQQLQEKLKEEIEFKQIKILSELVKIENSCFENPYSENLLKEDLENKNRFLIGAYFKEELIGYINFECVIDEIELIKICVLEEFRNYGIGSELLKKMLDFYKEKNCNKIFLEVSDLNKNAIKLYEKFNFKKISERKNYYKDNSNALIYVYGN